MFSVMLHAAVIGDTSMPNAEVLFSRLLDFFVPNARGDEWRLEGGRAFRGESFQSEDMEEPLRGDERAPSHGGGVFPLEVGLAGGGVFPFEVVLDGCAASAAESFFGCAA